LLYLKTRHSKPRQAMDEQSPKHAAAPSGHGHPTEGEVSDQLQRLLLALAAVEQQAKLLTQAIETEMHRLGFDRDISRFKTVIVCVSASLVSLV
jgi:hypothetical protein